MERIVPVICKIDRKGIDYTKVGGWIKKLGEEFCETLEAIMTWTADDTANARKHIALETMDIICVCISFLHWLGYNDADIDELIIAINKKNKSRGYHERKYGGEVIR